MYIAPILPNEEQEKAIKAGNREMINRFYFENLRFITLVCQSWYRNRGEHEDFWQDAVQEVYLAFPSLKFGTYYKFARTIKDVCLYVFFGTKNEFDNERLGRTKILTILDEPIERQRGHGGEPRTLADVAIDEDYDIDEVVCPPESYTDKIYECCKDLLTEREREAFEYFYYTDMTAREVGEKLGLKLNGAQSLKHNAIQRLKREADIVREKLVSIGYFDERVVNEGLI